MPSYKPHIFENGIESKICSKCEEYKPLTEFVKSSQNKDGLHIYCKGCRKLIKKQFYENNKETINKKTLDYYNLNKDEIRKKQALYNDTNREKINEVNAKWRIENADKKKEIDKKYYHMNKEKLAVKKRIYQQTSKHKELHNICCKNYSKTEKGLLSKMINRQRYRNNQNKVVNDFTREQWQNCKEYFKHSCAYCGKELKTLHKIIL